MEMNYAPTGWQYDKTGRLIPEHMAGNGRAYAPAGYRYTKQGDLKRIKQNRWREDELEVR